MTGAYILLFASGLAFGMAIMMFLWRTEDSGKPLSPALSMLFGAVLWGAVSIWKLIQ